MQICQILLPLLALPTVSALAASQDVGVGLERTFARLSFQRPVFLTGARDGSGRMFVCEQDGVIRVFSGEDEVAASEVFLDISARVSRRGNEEGLLGLAFAPDYAKSGEFYVHYSSSTKDEVGVVARFRVSADDANRADPSFEEVILEVPQPYRNHNGGMLAFGPDDGMLYMSFGDGGAADDPQGNGQNLGSRLGTILRVDVSGDGPGFAVPEDNPFVGREEALPEIWAYGLRNVWRFSFDRQTLELWAADVGQNLWEEVDLIERGGNYGWNTHEASIDFANGVELAAPSPHTLPVAEYGRGDGISITGGYVYRGSRHPELDGLYFYGDYVSGNLWSLRYTDDGSYEAQLERRTGRSIASFGEDDAGEVYLLSFDGAIYRIVPSDEPADALADWPRLLSETGLFESIADGRPAAHVLPYEVNAPFWSDGAEKQRFFALPEGEAFDYTPSGTWGIPIGTTLIKSFRIESLTRRPLLETRLIKRTSAGWEAATYLWDDRNTEATLAPEGRQFELYESPTSVVTWHAPSESECASCHLDAAGYALGITTAQLNTGSQLEDWIASGALRVPADFDALTAAAFCTPTDEDAPLETRARTWLDVNCAMCHFPSGPGNAAIDLRFDTYLEESGLLDGEIAQGDLGFTGASIIKPGDPERSILWQRVRTRGDGRMPNIGSNAVDEAGVQLLADWIESLQE